jgi:AAA+ ATPase superfamily predicted ATPase
VTRLLGLGLFVDRTEELAILEQLLKRQRSGELLLLYGRRRVGKTALLRHWASQSELPWIYWMAQKEPAELQRRKLYAAIRGRAATPTAPTFASWSELWDDVAAIIRDDRRILVLDELPWAIESDTAMLSALQYAWDIHFQHSNLILVLCGSQIRTIITAQSLAWYPSRLTTKSAEEDTDANRYCTSSVPAAGMQPGSPRCRAVCRCPGGLSRRLC